MSHPAHILLVEDDNDLATLLTDELGEEGYTVTAVASAEEAQERPWTETDLILCDLRLPRADGLDLLHKANHVPDPPGFILITAFGTVPQAVEALKSGADDFLTKPLDLEHLRIRVRRALEHQQLRREVAQQRAEGGAGHFHALIGQSGPMRRLYEQIRLTAQARGPVLIEGESGTGKELVAEALHAESTRANEPFVAVNCAAIPAELMESELFGHKAGAFTGAAGARRGLFAEAHGGTLFLDEIGEMPLPLQATLLRVLQDGRIRPVGADQEIQVDTRVVAATNRALRDDAEAARFRPDLFYRLETFALAVPPLSEREDDLELLAGRLISQLAQELGRGAIRLSEDALDCLRAYDFPGNVRELRNALERAVAFARDGMIRCRDLPERMQAQAQATDLSPTPAHDALLGEGLITLDELQRRYLRLVLEQTGGNKRRTAQILGVGRRTLYRYLDRDPDGDTEGDN